MSGVLSLVHDDDGYDDGLYHIGLSSFQHLSISASPHLCIPAFSATHGYYAPFTHDLKKIQKVATILPSPLTRVSALNKEISTIRP